MSLDDHGPLERRRLLGPLLKNVSRSFYLTLSVLPAGLREPVGLAYLLARAADTIADTSLVAPERRLELLLAFRAQVNGPCDEGKIREIEAALTEHQKDSHERALLQSLVPALALLQQLPGADRGEVSAVVTTLTRGMEMDLTTFPLETSGTIVALRNAEELDRYVYLVAGCVGEFWTKIAKAHTPALRDWDVDAMSACGVRFGKALQMTNVLRDCPKDLRLGRCYLPRNMLAAACLSPEALLDPANSAKARPVLVDLLRVAVGHYAEAQAYILAIPRSCCRLRLACLWPVLIGLPTLRLVAENDTWLDPERHVMVPTSYVKRTLALSVPVVCSNTVLKRWIGSWMAALKSAL
ncbi:MAG: phytoene/squalene synthase family protein [Planctomycetota bacterium]|nr:phytoene/squalene synthase family protein [Planctomycetota bacterium]